jgi:hypothetical protein
VLTRRLKLLQVDSSRRRRLRVSSSPPRHRRDAFLTSRRARVVSRLVYPAQRDTNLKRFRGTDEEDFEEEPPPPSNKPRSLVYRGVHFRNLAVRLVARSPFGARHLGTIQLRDETADLEKNFKSRIQTFAWIQGLAVRAVANVGFDVMDAAFSGAASAVTGLVFAPLDVADRVAERFGGSRVVTGVTGGVRSTVGGVVGGGTAVVGGSLAAGRALVQGATSGDLTQVGEAGRAFAGGVVGGVGSVVGGVAHAGQDVVGGVRAGVRSTSGL